ncbi:Pao retrotransposon peptidase family protein [Aphelenchoides avenae]|nr:Pao retrotransposon peptidase family protein [Aphelenchus avenae]
MYGLFAHSDGLLSEARPLTVQNTHAGYEHHQRSNDRPASSAWNYHVRKEERYERVRRSPLYPASFPAVKTAPDYRAADNAAGTTGDGYRSRRESRFRSPSPTRATEAKHRDPWCHDFVRDAAPAGRGRSSGPTYASADRTFVERKPKPAVDYGADFSRENASKFYRNGTHMRATSTKPSSLVLKELPIPKFNGDYRSYPMFRSRFLKTVGEREDLDTCDKFQYLIQHLDGEPLRMANRYVITDTNYFKILDRLEDRYGDPATLANILAQDFNKLKSVGQTSGDLLRFQDEAQHLTDQMVQLGQDVNSNPYWRHTLLSKMPLSLRTKISENLRKDPMTTPIQEILDCIFEYARLIEKNEAYTPWSFAEGNSGSGSRQCRPDSRSTAYRAGTYAIEADTTHAANHHERNRRCAYCGRDHWSLKCNIYESLTKRVNRIRQLGYCFLCLRGGHWSGTCPKRTNEPCRYCHDGQHHQSICRQAFRGTRQPFASLRHSPVRAPTSTSGHPGVPKTEPPGGSSSRQQAVRFSTPVNPTDAPGASPATSRPPSTQISPQPGADNSNSNRRKKSKGSRTGPKGRNGTTRPTTAYADENVIQMGASACGGDGLLPDHQNPLTTDRRSTKAEARWNDWQPGVSTSGYPGIPDVSLGRVPSDEEASLPESTGHCSDADSEPPAEEQYADDPSWFAANPEFQSYSGYAISTTSPADNNAVLLECLKTTAVNVNNGLTSPAIVFFDSGSNISYIGMKLARELQLPYLEKRLMRVNTFGTDVVTTVEGFATTVLLRSPQGASVALTLTASDRTVPPVTTALVADDEVQLLKKNKCSLISTREKPDLLIGQDLFHLFERRFGPQLPNGFHVTWTCLGPVAGGAGKVAGNRKAATTTHAAASSDPEPPSDTTTKPPSTSETPPPPQNLGYNPDDPLNLWTLDDTPGPADNAAW